MIKNKVAEIIIGIKVDDQFGPLIVIGSGGIYTELINDSVTLLLPLTKQIVLDAINNLKLVNYSMDIEEKKKVILMLLLKRS